MRTVKPLKRFGQNYLIDKNIINKIVDQLNPASTDCLIEIGPGSGSITEQLITRNNNLTLIEIDKRIIDSLTGRFPNLNVINGDFLESDLNKIYLENCNKKGLRFIGNIPFNITSPILFKLFGNRSIIKDAVFIIPFEIAKKLIAKPRTKDYGILTILVNYFTNPKICFKVQPSVFRPKPKILSAVIHLCFKKQSDKLLDENLFISVVKAAFGNRRKTLKNSLSNSIFSIYNYSDVQLNLSKRAEEFELHDFILLTKYFQEKINAKK